MKKQKSNLTDAASLRQKAEEKLNTSTSFSSSMKSFSEAETYKLIHELEVHQIELEMQNEELLSAVHKAEHAEEKYTELYDFALSGFISLSKDGKITELNFSAALMLGKERLSLIKNTFALFITEETRPIFNLFFTNVFTTNIKQSCEVIIATAGNFPKCVTIDGIVSQDDEFCLLTLIDITEKKLLDEALNKSQVELSFLSENIDAIIWRFDLKNDKWLYVSPQSEKILGFAPNEWINFRWWVNTIHPDDQIWATEFCINQTKLGKKHDFEYRLIHKNGNVVWIHDRVEVGIIDNEPAYIYGIMYDVTERKLTESKLMESEDFSRYLLQTIPFGMDIVDENGKVLFQSDNLKKLCGEETFDKKCWELYCDDKIQCSGCPLRTGIKVGTTEMYEAAGVMGGKTFEIIHTGMMYKGKKAMLEIFIDITQRKQSEAVFKDIIEKNPMSIQILDMEGYLIQVNSAHTKLFGVKPPSDYTVLKDTQLLSLGFSEFFERIKNGEVVYFPDTYYNVHDVDPSFPDSPVWVKALGFTLNDNNGKPNKIVLMHENITERKNAEA
ncbi:MAG: PAS domain-containing protein, partial [Bacteroidales bacterium]